VRALRASKNISTCEPSENSTRDCSRRAARRTSRRHRPTAASELRLRWQHICGPPRPGGSLSLLCQKPREATIKRELVTHTHTVNTLHSQRHHPHHSYLHTREHRTIQQDDPHMSTTSQQEDQHVCTLRALAAERAQRARKLLNQRTARHAHACYSFRCDKLKGTCRNLGAHTGTTELATNGGTASCDQMSELRGAGRWQR
jgi:hypothetical protein